MWTLSIDRTPKNEEEEPAGSRRYEMPGSRPGRDKLRPALQEESVKMLGLKPSLHEVRDTRQSGGRRPVEAYLWQNRLRMRGVEQAALRDAQDKPHSEERRRAGWEPHTGQAGATKCRAQRPGRDKFRTALQNGGVKPPLQRRCRPDPSKLPSSLRVNRAGKRPPVQKRLGTGVPPGG